jgi:hypothetical protein
MGMFFRLFESKARRATRLANERDRLLREITALLRQSNPKSSFSEFRALWSPFGTIRNAVKSYCEANRNTVDNAGDRALVFLDYFLVHLETRLIWSSLRESGLVSEDDNLATYSEKAVALEGLAATSFVTFLEQQPTCI